MGFEAGLAPFFARAPNASAADERLQLIEASFQIFLTPVYRATLSQYSVRFRAHLVDRTGKILERSFGRVVSPSRDGAVEAMYEAIAKDLFLAPPAVGEPRAAATPLRPAPPVGSAP
jgi:hypothetical protein